MPTLWVPGTPTTTAEPLKGESGSLYEEAVVAQIRLTPGTRSRAEADSAEGTQVEVEDEDLLQIELDDGAVIFTTVALYREDDEEARLEAPELASRGAEERGLGEGVIVFSGLPGRDLQARGLGSLAVRLLRVLRLKPVQESLAGLAVREVIEWREGKLQGKPGVYRVDGAGQLAPLEKNESVGSGAGPCLVFVHGTASSTAGSFGGLLEPALGFPWKSLFDRYQGRVFALEHHTLSRSPIDNVLDLARALAPEAELHLVSHSRGGLVGELLCLQPAQITNLDDYRRKGDFAADDQRDREGLKLLRELLEERRPRVTRFVRVACPARGTVLASKRMDFYFSVLFNVVEFAVSGPVAKGLLGFISDSVKAILEKKADPEALPGLEAQMPSSPLVRFLNTEARSTAADLSVIAGDLRGGRFKRLLNWASHLYFWGQNDLVVDTRAMYGGLQRPSEGAAFLFDSGPEVTHFGYFKNEPTRSEMDHRLRGEPDRFEPLEVGTEPSRHRAALRAATGPRPVVFVLPGIMGSHLAAGDNRIWLDKSDLAKGRMDRLAIGAPAVTAQAMLDGSYGDLVGFLSASHEVVEFPFDWRLSVLEEGARLGRAVAAALDRTDEPVRLLAHSMGGLVCRAMMAVSPDVWQRLCAREGGRLIQLGTPNRGSFTIPRLLLGREGVLKMLALLDVRHGRRDLLDIIRRFPGILEMLPAGTEFDFFELDVWKNLAKIVGDGWPLPEQKDLEGAKATRRRLDESLSRRERILYVAGTASETPHALFLPQGRRVVFLGTSQGDGRVPYELGLLDGVRTWYTQAEHGALAAHEPAFEGILDLLQKGETQNLFTQAPLALRAGAESFPLPEEDAVVFPDDEDLAAAALGYTSSPRGVDEESPIRVWVTHGDMAHARYPVVAGHYEGSSVNGAEKYLDYLVEGRLSLREGAGVYPGPVGTSDLVLMPGSNRRGALIVGLGAMSEMGARVVREGVRQAVARYLLELWERQKAKVEDPDEAPAPVSTGISALLVGTGLGSDLQVRDCIQAILLGVLEAEAQLRESDGDCPVSLDEVEIVEFFEEKAVAAAHALKEAVERIGTRQSGSRRLQASARLKTAPGGRRSSVGKVYDEPWYQQLIITQDERDFLRFVVLAESSRTEVSVRGTQRSLVDRLMQAATGPAARKRRMSSTLYELLVPNELKERAMDQNRLLLVVDPKTARYPWELLQPADSRDEEPLAVRTAMVRKLQIETCRPSARPSGGRRALVVGNPKTSSKLFGPLPGAEREAKLVDDLLGERFQVQLSLQETGLDVVARIFEMPYRVLHIAAHGTYDAEKPLESGIVLDDGLFLTATELGSLTVIPDLVFLNCCYLGKISETDTPAGRGFNELTASVAVQLMESGAKAVVAAGWAVEDNAALTFARVFYEEILAGRPLGDAVQDARRETFFGHRQVNTWGAYQAYGDPAFRLLPEGRRKTGTARDDELGLVSRREVVDRVRQLLRQAASFEDDPPESWRERRDDWSKTLDLLEKFQGDDLDQDGELLALAGEAWFHLLDRDKALDRLRRALAGDRPAPANLRSLELLCRLELLRAEDLRSRGTTENETEEDPLKSACERLEQLLVIGRSPRRLLLAAERALLQARLATRATGRQRFLKDAADLLSEGLRLRDKAAFEADLSSSFEELHLLVHLALGGPAGGEGEAAPGSPAEEAALRRHEQELAASARAAATAACRQSKESGSKKARQAAALLGFYATLAARGEESAGGESHCIPDDLAKALARAPEHRRKGVTANLGLLARCLADRVRALEKVLKEAPSEGSGALSQAARTRLERELGRLEAGRKALEPLI